MKRSKTFRTVVVALALLVPNLVSITPATADIQVPIGGELPPGIATSGATLSPDGRFLVMRTNAEAGDEPGLFVVSLADPRLRRPVSLPAPNDGSEIIAVGEIVFTADGRVMAAVYRGTPPANISGASLVVFAPTEPESVMEIEFVGDRIPYIASAPTPDTLAVLTTKPDFSEPDLLVVPLDGSSHRSIFPNREPGTGLVPIDLFLASDQLIDANGNVIVEVRREEDLDTNPPTPEEATLYLVAYDGSTAPIPLQDPSAAAGRDNEHYATTDDGELVFVERQAGASRLIGGSTSDPAGFSELSPLPGFADIERLAVSADGSILILVGDIETGGQDELFSLPIGGAPTFTKLSPSLPPDTDVDDQLNVSSGSADVIFRTVANGLSQIHAAPVDGATPSRPLTPPDIANLRAPQVSPDGTTIAVQGTFTPGAGQSLVIAAVDGLTEPVTLYERPAPADRIDRVQFTPAGTSVVFSTFSANDTDQTPDDLFVVPIDASTPARRITPPGENGRSISVNAITPDSRHVVYTTFSETNATRGPFVAPILPANAARFIAVPPARLFDTRDGTGSVAAGLVAANSEIDIEVSGRLDIPTDATAVVLNLTATGNTGPGFVTVSPSGRPRPLASNLNLTEAGQTRPNLVTVPLGSDGRISVYAQSATHLIGDVAGYYIPTSEPTAAGRLEPLAPIRAFDTRVGEPGAGPKGKLGPGGSAHFQIGGQFGVPVDAQAIVMNLTATDATTAGFVTAYPGGTPRPLASNINLPGPGSTTPNLVIVPLGADGTVEVYSQSGAHVLGDITGYITGASAPINSAGLFVALDPRRVFDTRDDDSTVPAGGIHPVRVLAVAGVPIDGVAAVALNITATGNDSMGFVTAFPRGVDQPVASTLNLGPAGDTRPNAAILPLGTGGQLSFFTQTSTHLLADVSGYFLS